MTKSAAPKRQETSPALVTWIVLAVIGLGGIGLAWGLQLSQGLGITGLGEQVVWGLYIAGFFTAMGAAAALVAFTAASEFVPLLPLAKRRNALLLALAGLVVGGVLITMDVGNPMNLWRILTAGRFTSLMTWDFLALILTGLLTLVYLIVLGREQKSTTTTRTLGVLAIIAAALLVVVEGWMLATLAARPLWVGGMTVVNFLVMALVAGLALAIMSWEEAAPKFSGLLKIGLWTTLGLLMIELLTVLVEGTVRPAPDATLALTGGLSTVLRIYLIVGLVLPLAILYWRKDLLSLRIAAGLAIFGVLAEKVWLLAAGQALPWLQQPQGSYAPSWVEMLGVIGAVALTILIYRALVTVFKVEA